MPSRRVLVASTISLTSVGGLGAWGLTHLLSKNKSRTFSIPRQISDLLKEKGLKVPSARGGAENDPIWNGKWDKFKKAFAKKAPGNIWEFPVPWNVMSQFNSNTIFVENCENFKKAKITTEADPQYEAIIEFCAEKE